MDISKIEAGKLELVEEDYFVQSLLQDVCIVIGGLAKKKNLKFVTQIDQNIPYRLHGAPDEIKEIITNILNNAIKYTNDGSVTLKVDLGEREGNLVKLVISAEDTGVGMRPEDVERVFEKFSKFDSKVNREVEGTGLGMAIVKALLDQMHGTIEVESVYGEGTRITVTLPQEIVDERPIGLVEIGAQDMGEIQQEHLLVSAKVLMVDDNETNLKVGSAILKKYGITCDLAASGKEAVEKAKLEKYDLVFLDHMMPEMDGIETMRALRGINDYYLALPMVALTANAITGVREQMLSLGFEGYLSKPIDFKKLEDILLTLLPKDRIRFVDGQKQLEETDDIWRLQHVLSDVDVQTGLTNCGGSLEDYISILEVVLRYGPKRYEQLKTMLAEEDYDNYVINVHALKSTAANIGARELSQVSAWLEAMGKEKQYDKMKERTGYLLELYQSLLQQIKEALSPKEHQRASEEKEPISNEELQEIIEGTILQLREFSLDEANAILDEMLAFALEDNVRELILQAKESVERTEVEQAITLLMQILL